MNGQASKSCGPTPGRPNTPPREQRRSIRYTPEAARVVLSWDEDSRRMQCYASLVDISGGGAAVLSDRVRGPGEAVYLRLICGSASMEGVEARVLAVTDDPSGKRLLRLKFNFGLPLDSILGQQVERRLSIEFFELVIHGAN